MFNVIITAIEKTKKMLDLAQSSQWDVLSEEDAERQVMLKKLNLQNVTISEQENDQLHAQMGILIELNNQLESLCQSHREGIAGELKNLRKSNKVAQAYSQ